MLWLVLGALVLFLLRGGMRAFERASVTSIKSLVTWVAALGGLSLALLLILTGRGGIALGALTLFGPLLWQRWRATRGGRRGGAWGWASRGGVGAGGSVDSLPVGSRGQMSRQEAYEVLGLQPGASTAEIR